MNEIGALPHFSGETASGKTQLVSKLLKDFEKYFTYRPEGLLILYSTYQEVYDTWKGYFDHTIMHAGIPDNFDELLDTERKYVVVCDDLCREACKSGEYLRVQTAGRHIGVVCLLSLWHSIFPSLGNSRLISQNFHVYFLMRSARLVHQVGTLGRQLGVNGSTLIKTYLNATRSAYSYLMIDYSDRKNVDRRLCFKRNFMLDEAGPVICYGV